MPTPPMPASPPPNGPGAELQELRGIVSFRRAWVARLLGTGAQQMLMVALGWQMVELTGRAWDLGLVGLAQFLPSLLLTLVAGHAADRFHRGRIIAACLLLQFLVAFVLMVGTRGGWVDRDLILGLSVLLGVARAFQMPAQQALLPQLVPARLLTRALALGATAMQAAIIGGPALGGALYALGVAWVYGLCALMLASGAWLLARIRLPAPTQRREAASLDSLLAGLRFIGGHRTLLGALSLDLFAVLLGGATALLPLIARDVLHTGPWGLGLLRAAPAFGALICSAWMTRWPVRSAAGRWLFGGVAVYGLAMVVFGLSTTLPLSLLALAVSGAADMVSVVLRQTLVQLETPDAMRGRVSAVNSVFIGASNQLGEFESGAAAAWLGTVPAIVAGGLGTLAVVLVWRGLFPDLWRRDGLHTPPTPAPAQDARGLRPGTPGPVD